MENSVDPDQLANLDQDFSEQDKNIAGPSRTNVKTGLILTLECQTIITQTGKACANKIVPNQTSLSCLIRDYFVFFSKSLTQSLSL